MDKHDTIRIAEKIGTLNISNEQFPDSCTVFASSSPATTSTVKIIEEEEAKLGDYNAVIEELIKSIEVFKHGQLE
jgi:thiamine biosynthesis protein ThiI